jgi:hypothetical protein
MASQAQLNAIRRSMRKDGRMKEKHCGDDTPHQAHYYTNYWTSESYCLGTTQNGKWKQSRKEKSSAHFAKWFGG